MAHQSSTKNYLSKIAIVGAGGNSGKHMAAELVKTGRFTVTAITRANSTSTFPAGVTPITVDYSDKASLVDALRGQDALIITLGVMAPKDTESNLIEAAAEAGVQFVFPNEWSPDTAHPELVNDMLLGAKKKAHRELVTRLGKSSYIAVTTGFWYEWSLAIPVAFGFDIAGRKVTLFDEGKTLLSLSTWPQVGRAVAAICNLKIHPDGEDDEGPCLERYRNRHVYVASFTISQEDMLESLLRVTGTKREDWTISKEPVRERYNAGIEAMQKGDRMGFGKALYAVVFFPDDRGNYEKTRGLDNDALGLSKEYIDEYTAVAIERSKNNPWH